MLVPHVRRLPKIVLAFSSLVAACSSSTTPPAADAGVKHDAHQTSTTSSSIGTSGGASSNSSSGSTAPSLTIAMVRQTNPTRSFTVKGFVTALAGEPTDYTNWYIEDPAGGEYSGINVYCDPRAKTPCTIPEPALHDLIEVTGTLSPFMNQLEIEPTAMTIVQSNATPPPVPTLTAADCAPGANSPYRGVYVQLTIPSKLVVDSVTPMALFDTACGAVIPTTDGGAPASCTNACQGPAYSGFQANDGTGNEVYIDAPFFYTNPLQSSPECLKQPGVVPVTVGMTFSKMEGVLDIIPYTNSQAISPVQTSDYATP